MLRPLFDWLGQLFLGKTVIFSCGWSLLGLQERLHKKVVFEQDSSSYESRETVDKAVTLGVASTFDRPADYAVIACTLVTCSDTMDIADNTTG
jgi:hypothetical protein